MPLPKTLRAATLAVASVFLLSALPAAAAPVLPSAKPAGVERAIDVAATTDTKKKPVAKKKKPVAKKKAPAKKQPV
ncbi:hypothetical protein EDC65_2966 [Stella humosa]|uniref:Uncharacterized protein n=1 Tax=Stella humosa TaxID=94 RepID=A0A3N1L8T2_9PROT|nr:hypothetical protein [Stella humosa]ROP91103.1 hypothetical protein EDC65_2966 [Stella humosa]BBK34546.1 hypothetical protein STHU_51800 [Stella humosa]